MLTFIHKLFILILISSAVQVNNSNGLEINSYARVSKNGDSIATHTNNGNDPPPNNVNVSHIRPTLIDKHDIAIKQQKQQQQEVILKREKENESIKGAEGKSEGRAIKSNYYFPLPNFLTKATQSNRQGNVKEGRLIVYPSYTQNIDQTRRRYDMPLSTGQVAQKRFSPSEAYGGTLYKIKHPENFQGYKYAKPSPTNPPVMMTPAPPPPAPPPVPQYLPPMKPPPPPQYLPPSKFSAPIVVADTTSPSPISTPFLPTIPPLDDAQESSSTSPVINLLNYKNNKIDTSYMPPELHAIKDSIDNNHIKAEEATEINDEIVATKDLLKFPPNSESLYLPPEMMLSPTLLSSYLPPPSGDPDEKPDEINQSSTSNDTESISPNDLHKFPPNVDSSYLLPEKMRSPALLSSYLPPPSGDPDENFDEINQSSTSNDTESISPNDLHKFPPNVYSSYLPPDMMKYLSLTNSYLPPPSGISDTNSIKIPIKDEDDAKMMMYLPPKDLHNFPPNLNSYYLPSEMTNDVSLINSYLPPPSGDNPSSIPLMPPPPTNYPSPPSLQSMSNQMNQQSSAMSSNGMNSGGMQMSGPYFYNKPSGAGMMMPQPPQDMNQDDMMSQPPPSPPMMDMSDMSAPPSAPMDFDDHHHDHHHHHDDHDHHHHPWDSYPDIIYDDHHHHHHHVEETTTTTEAPEEPRVKKYSYYYLGRKLWYIPLYFTFWFCLYVAALIIRSIGRHKVDLPNHYQRSLHDLSNREFVEKINTMTAFTMAQIEDFKEKYL